MTLLSVCQNAADNCGVDRPVSIIGNRLPAARRLLQAARRTGRNLASVANWQVLVTEHLFVAGGKSTFTLPVDFRSMINDTLWDRTRFWQMRGALTPQQWQLYKSSIIGRATIERRWRLRIPSGSMAGQAVQFQIDPDIGTTDLTGQLVYEYVSNNWVQSATARTAIDTMDAAILTDPDTGAILLDPSGNILTDGQNGAGVGHAVGDIITLTGGAFTRAISLSVLEVDANGGITDSAIVDPGYYTVLPDNPVLQGSTTGVGTGAAFQIIWGAATQNDWLADSDTSILDEDLLELGVIWRLLSRLGMAYQEEKAEYENQVWQAVARDGGTQTLHLAPVERLSLVGPYNVQEGNFPGA